MMRLTPSIIDAETIYPDFSWSLHQDLANDADPELVASIGRFGLLRPLIVKEDQGSYELICGARRLGALRHLDEATNIPCFTVDHRVEDREILMLVVEDQKQTGPLSPIQTARLIKMFNNVDLQPDKTVLQSATGTSSDGERKRLLDLLELEEPIRIAMHHRLIPVKTALTLAALPASERHFLADLFTRLSLNGNKQRRLLELARIISVSEQCSVVEVITGSYPELCGGSVDNIPQASSVLMKNLFERSHPRSTEAQRDFRERTKRLDLPGNCSLAPSPAFEKDSVTLTVEFKDFETLYKAWQDLRVYI